MCALLRKRIDRFVRKESEERRTSNVVVMVKKSLSGRIWASPINRQASSMSLATQKRGQAEMRGTNGYITFFVAPLSALRLHAYSTSFRFPRPIWFGCCGPSGIDSSSGKRSSETTLNLRLFISSGTVGKGMCSGNIRHRRQDAG